MQNTENQIITLTLTERQIKSLLNVDSKNMHYLSNKEVKDVRKRMQRAQSVATKTLWINTYLLEKTTTGWVAKKCLDAWPEADTAGASDIMATILEEDCWNKSGVSPYNGNISKWTELSNEIQAAWLDSGDCDENRSWGFGQHVEGYINEKEQPNEHDASYAICIESAPAKSLTENLTKVIKNFRYEE